jgi:hypothetical protein
MLLNKRTRRKVITWTAVCALVAFLLLLVLPGFLQEDPAPKKPSVREQQLETYSEPQPPAPLREPPRDVHRRELPPELAVQAPTQQVMRVLPPNADRLNPQWTKPLAMPVKDPVPPDPFTPPPISVDPSRRPESDVPRQKIR